MNRNKSNKIYRLRSKDKIKSRFMKNKTKKYKKTKSKKIRKQKQIKKTKKIKGGEKKLYRTRQPLYTISINDIPDLHIYLATNERNVLLSNENFDMNSFDYVVKIPLVWKDHLQKHPIEFYDTQIKKEFKSGYVPLSYIEDISDYIDNNYISEEKLKLLGEEARQLYDSVDFENDIKKLNKETDEFFNIVDEFTGKTRKKRVKRNLNRLTESPITKMKERFYAPPGFNSEDGGNGYITSKERFDRMKKF